MNVTTEKEIKEFNAALGKCTGPVWLMGPGEETYNMKSSDEYKKGISRLKAGNTDQLGIFTSSYEDEAVMLDYFRKNAA